MLRPSVEKDIASIPDSNDHWFQVLQTHLEHTVLVAAERENAAVAVKTRGLDRVHDQIW